MKSIIIVLTLISCAVLVDGCASAGTKIEQSSVSQIQKGKTTKPEVIALLGAPMSASLMGDGKEMMMWSYAQTQIKGATLIPIVGIFAGGSNTKMTTFQVILNKDKIVEDYLWNDSNIEAKMGK